MKRLLSTAVLAALACGDSGGSGGGVGLDPNMSGTWAGPTTLSIPGNPPQNYTGQIIIAVSGTTATFGAFCLDGSGSMTVQGSGDSAYWQGSYTCAPVAFTNCATVALTYQQASVIFNNGVLSASGSGTLTGCGFTNTFTLTLTGTRR